MVKPKNRCDFCGRAAIDKIGSHHVCNGGTCNVMALIDKDSAVNIIDPPNDGDVKDAKQLSFPEEYPAGETPDTPSGAGETSYHMPRQSERGQGLTDLVTEKHQVKPNQKLTEPGRWSDSYHNVNTSEDVDLKLGEADDTDPLSTPVYPPHTGLGPVDQRYEDANQGQRNIVVHSTKTEEPSINQEPKQFWIAVDLDGTILEPPPGQIYQDQSGEHCFGKPLEGAKEALQELVAGGARVSIYTARQYFMDTEEDEANLQAAVSKVLDEHDIPYTDVFVGKKPPASYYVDDKAIQFKNDWPAVLDAVRDKLTKTAGDDKVKAQKEYQGIKIGVEWPKGSIRSYEGDDTYVTHMGCDYGYAQGIEGTDQDSLDIYLGDAASDVAFVVEQLKEDGSYDEDKVMLGFNTEAEASDMYLQHMPAYMLGDIREVPVDKLKSALYGEPEDRRGQDDLVPSEELKKPADDIEKVALYTKLASYRDYAERILKLLDPELVSELFRDRVDFTKDNFGIISDMVRVMLTDGRLLDKLKSLFGPVEVRRPVEQIEKTVAPRRDFGPHDTRVLERQGDVFKPKVNKKTKSDYVGPSTSQVGGIGGVAAEDEKEKSDPKSHRLLTYRDLGGGGKDGEDKIIFVYGTLREREPNYHKFMEHAKFLGKAKTEERYNLVVSDDSPGLTQGESAVEGELYLVPKQDVEKIDKYEAPYKRDFVWLDGHQLAHAYFLPEEADEIVEKAPHLESDKASGVANPDWPNDENLDTDPTEDRESRDIPRQPNKENILYRNT